MLVCCSLKNCFLAVVSLCTVRCFGGVALTRGQMKRGWDKSVSFCSLLLLATNHLTNGNTMKRRKIPDDSQESIMRKRLKLWTKNENWIFTQPDLIWTKLLFFWFRPCDCVEQQPPANPGFIYFNTLWINYEINRHMLQQKSYCMRWSSKLPGKMYLLPCLCM